MADRNSMAFLAVGAVLTALVAVDFLPSVNSSQESVSPMKMSAKIMGPTLRFMYW